MKNIDCHKCKMTFGMSDSFYDTMIRLKEQGTFYCPAGHPQHFVSGETLEDKLRRERDRAIQDQARLQEELTKANIEMQRVTKRTLHGICPCCNRTFSNVARHMKTKHPEIVKFPKKKVS